MVKMVKKWQNELTNRMEKKIAGEIDVIIDLRARIKSDSKHASIRHMDAE